MTDSFAEESRKPELVELPAEFVDALLCESQPWEVSDFSVPAAELTQEERLIRLAHIKALLPANNAIDENTTHDATLENYIRLALQSAGDRSTLDAFLTQMQHFMEMRPEDSLMLAQQVFWVWAPAAEIAGYYNHKTDLEELAFAILKPEENAKLKEAYDIEQLSGADGMLNRLEDEFAEILGLTLPEGVNFHLSSRPKSYYSIWRKLQSEKRTHATIFDLIGLRVVIDGEIENLTEQCYTVMAAAVGAFASEHGRYKDYIISPKPNGYRSIHLTLYTAAGMHFELQIRTQAMHDAAENDALLSHKSYDATIKQVPGKIVRLFPKGVPKLYRWRDDATQLIEEAGGNTTVLQDDILFFRDDGNLYKIQAGANMLDASFRVHSHRALKTQHIYRIGDRPVSLGTELRHGDALHIEYAPDYPVESERFDELRLQANLVGTRKMVERGRRLRLAQRYQEAGRQIILTALGDIGLEDPFSVLTNEDRRTLIEKAGLPSFEKLLEVIGFGDPSGKPSRVVRFIKERCGLGPVVRLDLEPTASRGIPNHAVLGKIEVPGIDNPETDCQIAGCCSERIIDGEGIVARASRIDEGASIKVHRVTCSNVRTTVGLINCSWKLDT